MQSSVYDDAWWIALVLPLIISLFIFLTATAIKATRRTSSLTYVLQEERNAQISSVTTSTLTVWNDGTEIIELSNFARTAPFAIHLSGANIFRSELIRVSRPENDVSITEADPFGNVSIDFDFLAPGDGFRWQGDHDLTPGVFRLEGWIKGAGHPVHDYRPTPYQLKLGLTIAMFGVWYDMLVLGTNLIIHEGIRSWMFITWLPAPIFGILGSAMSIASLINEWRDPGPKLLRAWDRDALGGKLPELAAR
ncbi:hypothetical protein ASF70_02485 [Rhizobium sp. Leaf321]|uniref:hypothetical protein n=1 Tax=Rhizobium sp. Leaf321 TaxID=1736335 RepID=UPI0007160BEC|nr:hypothetical protein [Rhizobium sp. Leaf321]KQQ78109.1 hypothetical protein ASF70_02485 [Rhizobium sp. Leaf321]